MHQFIHLAQVLVGLLFTLALLGWCLYRLAILFGLIKGKKKNKLARRQPTINQAGIQGKEQAHKGQKQVVPTISRRALYSAKRERN